MMHCSSTAQEHFVISRGSLLVTLKEHKIISQNNNPQGKRLVDTFY
jgi:hypothetical protein